MKALVGYMKDYFRTVAYARLALTILFVATLITLNYTVGIERRLFLAGPAAVSVAGFTAFYLFVLVIAWMIQLYGGAGARPGGISREARLRLMAVLLLAPLFFACKMVHWDLSFLVPGGAGSPGGWAGPGGSGASGGWANVAPSGGSTGWAYPWNRYVPIVLQLPAKLLLLALCLAIWKKFDRELSFGLTTEGFRAEPYLAILAMLIPLIVLASTQHDFLQAYPRLRNIAFMSGQVHPLWPWRLLYELSYGLDFVTIELFFRGLLVVALSRWLGPGVIMPMAAFYCTVHFGKPLGECISSFAGGLALGVLAWRTRSILGGLMVHLGIAWMMEVGGWVGNGL